MITLDTDGQGSDFGSDVVNTGDGLRVNESILRLWKIYLDFFFTEKNDRIFSSDSDGSKAACLDGFEGVLNLEESSFGREYSDEIFVSSASFAHCYGARFEIFLKFISKINQWIYEMKIESTEKNIFTKNE